MVDISLLGTAGAVPLPDRALTACVITVNGRSILFDCGEGTQTAARKADVNLMRTDVIALTHYHGDHIFGIPGLLQSFDLGERTAPLYIVGPVRPGLSIEQELGPVLALTGRLGYELRLIAMPEDGLAMHKLSRDWPELARLDAFRTEHRVNSLGYAFSLGRAGKFDAKAATERGVPRILWRVLQNGASVNIDGNEVLPSDVMGPPRRGIKVVFSGDTTYCDGLTDAARDADLLVCEATYGANEQEAIAADYGHMTFAQAGITAARAGAKRLWLTHFSQRIADPAEFLPNAAAMFPAAECGFDGKRVTLEFDKR
ncbi:MAG: ribonuclease Z [Clostridia bacterium]|nr:ribonuclease Z [Clostridia bacterium]